MLRDRLTHAWNAFRGREPHTKHYGAAYSRNPYKSRLTSGNEKSIVASIYNQIAVDASSMEIRHVKVNENGSYLETVNSSLNQRFSVEANMDQAPSTFMRDIILSMFDEGCVAIIPVDTDVNPKAKESYKINSLRVAEILQWFPKHVQVRAYNDRLGQHEDILLPKKMVAIVENPLYTIMNEPNSTAKRLVRKLNLLDVVDEQSSSGKLDLIIKLPYIIKSAARKEQAEKRRQDIEQQLAGSKYGIAYVDGTENITQLNRPAENNLMEQVTFLTSMLHSQLGLTQSIFDGTADEKTMINYHNRTIKPILTAITEEMNRKFLTKTARTQKQAIIYLRDPFRLVPVSELADVADKFSRNEILSSNEMRSVIGFKPLEDPKADELRNKNMPQSKDQVSPKEGIRDEKG